MVVLCTPARGVLLDKRGWFSPVELSSSSLDVTLSDVDVTPDWGLGTRNVKAPTRWMVPDARAKKVIKWVTFKPVEGSVKYLDARTERKSGDKPKSAMLAPDAAPRCRGKAREAAKSEEKYLLDVRTGTDGH
jgi:hypothetical protein